MPGFTKVDRKTFDLQVWPKIVQKVEAIESNWKAAKLSAQPIVIKWGYRNAQTGEPVILAMSRADEEVKDEHWAADGCLPNCQSKRRISLQQNNRKKSLVPNCMFLNGISYWHKHCV